jgi:O-antigen/teichoic acid export membrane protein
LKESESKKINYSGSLIAKNAFYNILGYGVPLIFALAIIPSLIKNLGQEKFGILSLTWVVIGYFSFFDFGIGKALTKIISEKIGKNKSEEIPKFFWTSFFLMLFVSLAGSLIVFLSAHIVVYKIFNISESLQKETLNTFYVLAISIPIVTTTAGIRGFLEAYQKFGIINIIRTFLGVSSFVVPLLCLFFTDSLYWIVMFLVLIRIIVWVLYLFQCFKLNDELKKKIFFESNLIKPILRLGGWMTVSNITVPLIVYMDRFLIGAIVSATAIAFYTTPYEVISKLLIIPGAITGVLFPTFSANYLINPDFSKKLSIIATKYVFFILYPIVLIIMTFANEGLNLWLGKNFAENSTFILQFLALGVLFNSIAYIPFTVLEGIGRPDITAKIQLFELPIYFIAMWFTIKRAGINGAALVWFLRMLFDAAMLFFFAQQKLHIKFGTKFKAKYPVILSLIFISFFLVFINHIILKFSLLLLTLVAFTYLVWKFFLEEDEKNFMISRIRPNS